MSGLARFLAVNKSISRAIRSRLPHARLHLHDEFARIVAEHMNARPGVTVADVGGGKATSFARYRDPVAAPRIIAIDISAEELAENRDADDTRVADVTKTLPLAAGEADLVVSKSVLEHLVDVEAFIEKAASVLPAGGYFIGVFPSKYAPFSLLNRLLPRSASRRVLQALVPCSRGVLGFPAYYDKCSAPAMSAVLERNGFTVTDLRLNYYQADYFAFFLPLYLMAVAYELIARAMKLPALAASVLIVARRGAPADQGVRSAAM